MSQKTFTKEEILLMKRMIESPFVFIEKMWGKKPMQEGETFNRDIHVTDDQRDLLQAVMNATNGAGKKRISVASGHGTGKSTTLAWIILWYLFTRKDAQIPCTAPTSAQLNDILWKEIAKWKAKMPKEYADMYVWSNEYIRMSESPETWFARAKTARKEAPEALAGMHGDHVMFVIDEASGVHDEIFNVAEGALTEKDSIVVMISNPTRLTGYFYESQNGDKEAWECLQFNSENSPIVDNSYVQRIIEKNGKDSDEYKIRVKGEFPDAEGIDDKGFLPLYPPEMVKKTNQRLKRGGKLRLGIDPGGQGTDETVWVVRSGFQAEIAAREKTSDDGSIAKKTLMLMQEYGIEDVDVFVDNFGVGANVAQRLAFAGEMVNALNVGDAASDETKFYNLRAEAYWRSRLWFKGSGEIYDVNNDWKELGNIRYTYDLQNRVRIKTKKEMRADGIPSPNVADAFMLTFTKKDTVVKKSEKEKKPWEKKNKKLRESTGMRNHALRGWR